jgi:hypothetical protein
MADTYPNVRCMRCGKYHTLYDASVVRHQEGGTYSYTCPADNRRVEVRWLRVPEVVEVVPDDAVPMEWVSG